MADGLRWEKVQETARAMAEVLRTSDLTHSEGSNALVQLVYECCMYLKDQEGMCPRCMAVALVECLMAQPHLTHLALEAEKLMKKTEGHDGRN